MTFRPLTGTLRRGAGVATACVVLAVSLGGCGQPAPEPAPEAQAQTTAEAAPEPPAAEKKQSPIPAATFTASDGTLVNVSGEPLELDGEMAPAGAVAEDRVVLCGKGEDKAMRVAIADGSGAVVAELDDALAAYGTVVDVSDASYADGFAVVHMSVQDADRHSNTVAAVFDRDGKEVFSIGTAPGCTVQDYPSGSPDRFVDGRLNRCDKNLYFDATGAQVGATERSTVVAGPSLCVGVGSHRSEVYGLNGTLVYDIRDLSNDDVKYGLGAVKGLLGGNIAWIEGSQQPKDGGSTRTVEGLLNLEDKTWVVPLSEGLRDVSTSLDGFYALRLDDKSVLDGSYDHTAADNEDYACIIDAKGNVVFDRASSSVEALADGGDFNARHLTDGYWYLDRGYGLDGSFIVYINESGAFVGAEPTSFLPSSEYDELNAMLEVD